MPPPGVCLNILEARQKQNGSANDPEKFLDQDYHQLKQYCLIRNLRFVDDMFPPDKSSIGTGLLSPSDLDRVEWLRPMVSAAAGDLRLTPPRSHFKLVQSRKSEPDRRAAPQFACFLFEFGQLCRRRVQVPVCKTLYLNCASTLSGVAVGSRCVFAWERLSAGEYLQRIEFPRIITFPRGRPV